MKQLKVTETEDFKITVEELSPFKFIATAWDKTNSYEVDRRVFSFETFGGAVSKAFDLLEEQI